MSPAAALVQLGRHCCRSSRAHHPICSSSRSALQRNQQLAPGPAPGANRAGQRGERGRTDDDDDKDGDSDGDEDAHLHVLPANHGMASISHPLLDFCVHAQIESLTTTANRTLRQFSRSSWA